MSGKKKEVPKITYLPKIVEEKIDRILPNQPNKIIRYEVFNSLGRGGFAECFRVVQMQSKKQFALKVIDKNSENMKKFGAFERLKNEVHILLSLKHDHIVRLYTSFQDNHNYYLLMELCSKISLVQMCKNRGKIHEIQVKYFIKQIIKALLYLKQKKIIHRDVKTPNILLDQNLDIKLGDFGLAIPQDFKDKNQRYSHCGTPSYMAPQVVKKHKYSYQVDMWSVGVVTFYMIFGVHPFSNKEQKDTYVKIEKLDYKFPQPEPNDPKSYASYQAIDFIKRIFVLEPKDRLTPQQALYHPFLRDQIPTRLPIQSYHFQIPIQQLLQYFKDYNQQVLSVIPSQNKKQKRYMVTRNRQITDYFKQPNKQPLQITQKTTKKERMNKKKLQKEVLQKKKQLIELLQRREKIKEVKQELLQEQRKIIDNFQVKIAAPQKQVQNLYQNAREQYHLNENNVVQSRSFIHPQQHFIQNQNKGTKQNNLAKIQEKYYKNNSKYIFQSQIEQNNKELSNDKLGNQQNRAVYQQMDNWLNEKLEQQVYIHEFVDNSHLYGVLIHLSNGMKLVKFNDKSVIIMNQSTKKVLYLQFIRKQAEDTEKIFYKLVINQKLGDCQDKLSNPVRISTKSARIRTKFGQKYQKYHSVIFKASQVPEDEMIMKKLEILKQYCHSCGISKTKSPPPSTKENDEHELYKFGTMIQRWGKRGSQSKYYLFITRTFYQICLDQDNQYFMLKRMRGKQLHKFNLNQLQRKTFVFPMLNVKKQLTRKQQIDMQLIQIIVKNFIKQQRATNGFHKELPTKIL